MPPSAGSPIAPPVLIMSSNPTPFPPVPSFGPSYALCLEYSFFSQPLFRARLKPTSTSSKEPAQIPLQESIRWPHNPDHFAVQWKASCLLSCPPASFSPPTPQCPVLHSPLCLCQGAHPVHGQETQLLTPPHLHEQVNCSTYSDSRTDILTVHFSV